VAALRDADIATYAAVLAAADARRPDSALLARALTSRSPALRVEAARAAGQLHVGALAPSLRAILRVHAGALTHGAARRADTALAAAAAFSLGLMRDTAAVGDLAAAVDGASSVGVAAAWSLGEIGEPARRAIERGLETPPRTAGPLGALLVACARLDPVPVAAVLRYATGDVSGSAGGSASPAARGMDGPTGQGAAALASAARRGAAYALSRRPAPTAVRALAGLAASSDVDTRLFVARGLGHRAAGDSLAGLAQGALRTLVRDPDAHVRAIAVQAVAGYGPGARAEVAGALHDDDANVRVAAAGVLDRVLSAGRGRGEWSAAFLADTSLAYRRQVVGAAVRAGVILDAIDRDNPDRWQKQGDWHYRAAAAEAAQGTSVERTRDLALPLSLDRDGRVRAAAYAVFAPWLDSADAVRHPWRRELMQHVLDDPDPIVRATALGAFTARATAADAPEALDAYRRARGDTVADARLAAIALLNGAWRNDSAGFPDSLRARIAALPRPTDVRELEAAGGGSLWSRWRAAPPGVAQPHPSAWYDSIVRAVVVPSLAGHPLVATIATSRGPLRVTLLGDQAPLTVANFVALVRAGYYRGTAFHRVVPAFVVQDGDPRGDGNGGPADAIRDELTALPYRRGTMGMALSGPDTGGSQYFFTLTPQPHLDGHYTAFGALSDGFATLDRIVQGDAITGIDVQ